VWKALRSPREIANWFGWDAPTLEEEIKMIFLDGSQADENAHRLQFGEWEGVSDSIILKYIEDGTRITVERAGGPMLDASGAYDDVVEGWVTFVHQLRLALDQHPSEQRQTIYLSGASLPGSDQPRTELGLTQIAASEPATPYNAVLPTGEVISGTLWHKTHHQTGLLVEQWGNGLLVVSDMGASPKRANGRGSVLLTTYGLSHAQFSELEQRWRQWWNTRFSA